MSLAQTIKRTERYLEEETAAQKRLLKLLKVQEAAIRGGDTARVLAANENYAELLKGGSRREDERRTLLREFGTFYGIDPRVLTLSSIVERLGDHGKAIAERRVQLRQATSDVLRASRGLASMARYHRGIVEEVLSLMQPEEAGDGNGRGALVHVEA